MFKRFIYSIVLKFLSLQERKCARCADMVYVYSNEIGRRLELNEEDVKLMRTPHMSMDDFKYRNDTCQSDVVRLLRVCWLMPNKGIEYLLEAAAMLVRRGLSVKLEIVGKEDFPRYQEKLEKVAERFEISDRVIFTGWVPFNRIQDVYLRSDIQIISSIAEGTPRCIQEGAARGLPLVSTTAGGCADALTDQVNALLVPPADAKSIADAVEKITKGEGLRKKLIKGGYEMASKFTFENAGMQFLNELKEIAGL
jgi:glycosyltransferase involved in cell wall biosynthesis